MCDFVRESWGSEFWVSSLPEEKHQLLKVWTNVKCTNLVRGYWRWILLLCRVRYNKNKVYCSYATQVETGKACRRHENFWAFATIWNSVFPICFLQHIKFVLGWFFDSSLKALMNTVIYVTNWFEVPFKMLWPYSCAWVTQWFLMILKLEWLIKTTI